jgi:hypothetical protein
VRTISRRRLAVLAAWSICTGKQFGNDHRAHHTDRDVIDSIRLAIKAEWELFQEKTKAALSSLVESEDEA